MNRTCRLLGAAAVAAGALLTVPATGLAVSATITDDAGNAVPLTDGMTLRNMAPTVQVVQKPGDVAFTMKVTTPSGEVDTEFSCSGSVVLQPQKVRYAGPGTYRVEISSFKQEPRGVARCGPGTGTGTVNAAFNLQPSVSLGEFRKVVLTRPPGRRATSNVEYAIPMNGNPGAGSNEVVMTGPGLPAEGTVRSVDPATNAAGVIFFTPGAYQLTPRATIFSSLAGNAPVLGPAAQVLAKDPFDTAFSILTDRTGPRYAVTTLVRTKYARGKRVTLDVRRSGAKKWRRVGSGKIAGNREVKIPFTLRKVGRYQTRLLFRGSRLVAPGGTKGAIRIYTRYFRR